MKCTSFEQVCKDNYGDEFGFVEPENITWIMRVGQISRTFNYQGFAGRTSVEVDNYNYTTEVMQVFAWKCLNSMVNSCQHYACQCYSAFKVSNILVAAPKFGDFGAFWSEI